MKEEDAEKGRGRGRLKPAPVLKVKQLNKAKIRTPLTVCICVCLCALQHGTLCHCDGSRPEQQKEAGGGGKREEMNEFSLSQFNVCLSIVICWSVFSYHTWLLGHCQIWAFPLT